jgi:phospholipid-binding lipoprotein MlaA
MTSKALSRGWSALAAALARHALGASSAAAIALAIASVGQVRAAATDPSAGAPNLVPTAASPTAPGDPFEPSNRRSFNLARRLDRAMVRPAAVAYGHALPKLIRTSLAHFGSNLGEPEIFANDALQGRVDLARNTVLRFTVNSTVGIGGLRDVAKAAGLPHHHNDFGLTLGRYGVAPGPYLFLPLVGPSSLRDGVGTLTSLAMKPQTYVSFGGSGVLAAGTAATSALDRRGGADGDLKAITAYALDPYAAIRSYYLQARDSEVRGGVVSLEALPDFGEEVSTAADARRSAP